VDPEKTRISVIIPTHNRLEKLTHVLWDLEAQTLPLEQFEVIVADDGSPEDPTGPLAALPLHLALTTLHLPQGGPARARNRALAKARGTLVLFLNDDIRLAKNLLEAHCTRHETMAEPLLILGAFQFSPELREDVFCRILEDFGFTHTPQLANQAFHSHRSCWTSNLSIPRQAIDYIGGFDENFPEPCGEDLDLGYRLETELGMRLYHDAALTVFHDHLHDQQMWRQRNRMVGRNSLRLYRKLGIGANLDPLKLEGRFDLARVHAALVDTRTQLQGLKPLEPLLEGLLAEPLPSQLLRADITLDDDRFALPEDRDLLTAKIIAAFEKVDQHLGLLEALEGMLAETAEGDPRGP